MTIDRRTMIGLAATGMAGVAFGQTPPPLTGGALPAGLPQPTETIDLWPKGAPGAPAAGLTETVNERSTDPQLTDRAVFGISRPRMAVFRPSRPNGAAVLITPGGGYRWVVVDKEGYELGRWLSARGYTVFVLFYRLPGEGWAAGPNVVLQDCQRAMRLIRHRAAAYAIDPERVAAMGFSAGGHACADLAARFATPVYDAVDQADSLSARPFVAAPIYPVISMSAPIAHAGSREKLVGTTAPASKEAAHSPHLNIPANAPPHFILHAEDDDVVPVENALILRAALRAKNIPVETHLFTHGGHGFGLRKTIGKPVEAWPDLFTAWAHSQGL
ncbi:alpha/beta hydrolase [Sphingorhabdus contaminans]|uniref:Alpha/beta hydrolase n=1 Tax=Sphingorhabdus contaminans TaxID=1343899 RepID=A0A553WCL7_9SPHN|nr:alpha/beta hydrolase [Sphingorhabdus contaminans]TSB02431.1 alpha/beta hydrolase [Sphingorhabdus contaminans]